MKPAPEKPPRLTRPRGKALCPLVRKGEDIVLLAQVMELVDDITLLKMRANQIAQALMRRQEES